MKSLRRPRSKESIVSSVTLQQIVLMLGCFAAVAVTVEASQPGWWASSGAVNSSATPADYSAVAQGQLKQFTEKAVVYLDANLTNGAGSTLDAMVAGWSNSYRTNGYSATHPAPRDLLAVNQAQLKTIADLIYGRLSSNGYYGLTPNWIKTNSRDYNLANQAQLKTVFNFDITTPPETVANLTAYSPANGAIQLAWTLPATNNANGITLQQSTNGGVTWTAVTTLSATNTSYQASGLDTNASYSYQVVVANAAGSSGAAAANAGTPVPTPPPSPIGLSGLADGTNAMDLTWSPSLVTTSYLVERETLATGIWSPLATTSAAAYQDTASGFGGYHYRVSAVNPVGTSPPCAEYPVSRYAVIDLGTNVFYPFKITNSGYVLNMGLPSGLGECLVWYQGQSRILQPLNSPLSWSVSDIGEDGTVVGYEYPVPVVSPVTTEGNLAVWAPTATTPTLTSAPVFWDSTHTLGFGGYERGHLGDRSNHWDRYNSSAFSPYAVNPLISPSTVWSLQITGYDGRYLPVDGFTASRTANSGGTFGIQTEMGAVTLSAGQISGTAVFPIAVNNGDQCLTETDSQYTLGSYDTWIPGTTTYSVGGTALPAGMTPADTGRGILSNPYTVNGQAHFNVLGNTSIYLPNYSWECWDGVTGDAPWIFPQPVGTTPTAEPLAVNARTTSLTGTNGTQTVAAPQAVGIASLDYPYVIGYLWELQPPAANGTQAFAPPQKLDALLPAASGWSQVNPTSLNDGGAIVGTATYSGSNTNIAPGSHGVMLIQMDLVKETTPGSGTYTHIDAPTIFPADNGEGRGAPPSQGSPKGVFVLLSTNLTTTTAETMKVSLGGPSGYFTGTLTETAVNSGIFQNTGSTVTLTLPTGTTTSGSVIDAFTATITSSSLGFSSTKVTLVESAETSLYFGSPIGSAKITFASSYNASVVNHLHLNLSLQSCNTSGAESVFAPISLDLTESSAGSKIFTDSVSGLTVSLSGFTGTNSGSVDSMVASFSGGSVGSTALDTTLTETNATSMDFRSQVTMGNTTGNAGADITPVDPQVTQDGVFYLRVSGTTAMTFGVQTDVGATQQVTLSPDPSNPGSLISPKMIVVPQGASGNTNYTTIAKTFATAQASSTTGAPTPLFSVYYPGTTSVDIANFKLGQGMFLGLMFYEPQEAFNRLTGGNTGIVAEEANNLRQVEFVANPNLKLNGCTLKDQSVNKADLLAAVPYARYMYLVSHSVCEYQATPKTPCISIPYQNIVVFGNGREDITADEIAEKNGTHIYQLVFMNGCMSGDDKFESPLLPPYPLFHNNVIAMATAFNARAYVGWDNVIDGGKAVRGGLAFFTALNGAITVDQAAVIASRATPEYVPVDATKCKSVKGGSLSADQLAKPNSD